MSFKKLGDVSVVGWRQEVAGNEDESWFAGHVLCETGDVNVLKYEVGRIFVVLAMECYGGKCEYV